MLNKKLKKKQYFSFTLLEQHYAYLHSCTSLIVGKWHTSDVTQNKETFVNFLKGNDVVLITAEFFQQAYDQALIKPEDCAVIVMDECHHCLGERHPYRLIMERIKAYKKETRKLSSYNGGSNH